MGTYPKINTKMQKNPWRKFLVYSNIRSKKNKKRISPLLGSEGIGLTNRVKVKLLEHNFAFLFCLET